MNHQRWVIALALFLWAPGALGQTSRAEKLQELRKALRGGGGGSATPRHPPPKSENVDMRTRALDELRPADDAYSYDVTPSAAVVRTQTISAEDPVYYSGLQLGLTVQPYQPRGVVPLVTLGERDLGAANSTWMPGVEARWQPWMSQILGQHSVGFRVGAGYVRQDLALYAPTGVRVTNTSLHSLQTYASLSQEWVIPAYEKWSLNLDLGVTRFDMLVTSSSTLGETSDDSFLATLRLGPAYRLGNFSFQLNYERRERLNGGWARLQENGVLVGILYGIR